MIGDDRQLLAERSARRPAVVRLQPVSVGYAIAAVAVGGIPAVASLAVADWAENLVMMVEHLLQCHAAHSTEDALEKQVRLQTPVAKPALGAEYEPHSDEVDGSSLGSVLRHSHVVFAVAVGAQHTTWGLSSSTKVSAELRGQISQCLPVHLPAVVVVGLVAIQLNFQKLETSVAPQMVMISQGAHSHHDVVWRIGPRTGQMLRLAQKTTNPLEQRKAGHDSSDVVLAAVAVIWFVARVFLTVEAVVACAALAAETVAYVAVVKCTAVVPQTLSSAPVMYSFRAGRLAQHGGLVAHWTEMPTGSEIGSSSPVDS